MKTYALTLLCSVLASLAWAVDAPSVVMVPSLPGPASPVLPSECAPVCVHKVCVPEPTVKKTDKAIYDEKCVDYCLPKCSLASIFSGHGCGCGDGGCVNCGCPRVKHVLIKHWVHEECPETKCDVQIQPVCPVVEAPPPPAK